MVVLGDNMDVTGDSGGTTWMSWETVEGLHDVPGDNGGTTWMSQETVEG